MSRMIAPAEAASRNHLITLPTPPTAQPTEAAGPGQRLLMVLAIDGDLRFISHRDTVRMLERALVRGGLPVAYSRGFNPHIRLSLPLPRAVGLATDGDLVVVDLAEPREPPEIARRLSPQLPSDARLLEIRDLQGRRPRLTGVHYEVPIPGETLADLPARLQSFLQADSVVVRRQDEHGRPKADLDIRPFVVSLTLEQQRLCCSTRFLDGRTVAPKDLVAALQLDWSGLRHLMRRTKVTWQ